MPRILIFEDNASLRQLLQNLLANEPDCQVVGAYETCTEAYTLTRQAQPDVVIMDIDMPITSGIEGVHLVKAARPETNIIMHTVFEDDENLFAAICAGASGYLLKKHSFSKLIDAVKDVVEGGAPLSPGIAKRVLAFFKQPIPPQYGLTPRETDMLTWLVKGYSYKMIAAECQIGLETVKRHLTHVYEKLHVSCNTEAVAKALREGIVKNS